MGIIIKENCKKFATRKKIDYVYLYLFSNYDSVTL